MWFDLSFFNNPFESQQYSRARKLLFAEDQIARLQALNPGVFSERIMETRDAASGLSVATSDTGAAASTQRGSTVGADDQLQKYRQLVGRKYNVLLDRFEGNKKAELLMTIFGSSIQTYTSELTKTNANTRIETLSKLLAEHLGEVSPAVAQPIIDAGNAYIGARSTQTANKGTTSVAHLYETSFEGHLNRALWLNLAAVVQQYPHPEDTMQRHLAADFSLLLRRAVGLHKYTESGLLLPTQAATLVDEGLLPTTRLRLHNTGPVALRLLLATAPNHLPGSQGQAVAPGEKLDLPAGDLGDVATHPFLLVHNPAPTGATGAYTATVG